MQFSTSAECFCSETLSYDHILVDNCHMIILWWTTFLCLYYGGHLRFAYIVLDANYRLIFWLIRIVFSYCGGHLSSANIVLYNYLCSFSEDTCYILIHVLLMCVKVYIKSFCWDRKKCYCTLIKYNVHLLCAYSNLIKIILYNALQCLGTPVSPKGPGGGEYSGRLK